MKTTITEALAEVKLIDKKLQRKMEYVNANLMRVGHTADPLVNEGGGREAIRREIQSIEDLYKNLVTIRAAISKSNTTELATVMGETKTITEWLVWKKEVADKKSVFYQLAARTMKQATDNLSKQPQIYKDEKGEARMVELIPNADYSELVKIQGDTQEKLDKLDGVLSLKNATTVIDI